MAMIDDWRDYPAVEPGLAEWLADLARQGYEVGEPIAATNSDGAVVLRYPVRKIT